MGGPRSDAVHPALRELHDLYYGDDHAPPHFHVVGRGFKAIVRLSDLKIDRGTLPRGVHAEAVAWAAANLKTLNAAWSALNERD